jgi:hypothetical protein
VRVVNGEIDFEQGKEYQSLRKNSKGIVELVTANALII